MQFTINPPNVQLVDGKGYITTQWYRWFSRVTTVIGDDVIASLQAAPVITYSPSEAFPNSLTLAQGPGVSITSGGGSLIIGLGTSGVTAGSYGGATKTVSYTVDQYGRITATAEYTLNSDNVTEGTANLYFTTARARSSISAGTGLTYNSGTGVMAAGAVLAAYAGGDTPSAFTLGIVDSADAAAWRAAIGAGTSSNPGTVTSVSGSGGTTGLTLTGGPITGSGTLTLGGTLNVANGGTGATSFTANKLLKGNGTSAVSSSSITDTGSLVSIDSGVGFSIARTAVTSPAANDGNVFSGTYTPTITAVSNISSTTPATFQYIRVGNVVTVSGKVSVTATAAGGTDTILAMSLPIASNFAFIENCGGTGLAPAGNQVGSVFADAATDLARLRYFSITNIAIDMIIHFTYRII